MGDITHICLLIIDPQVDFHRGGSLAVPGADEDTERIVSLLENCSGAIDRIVVTQDCHRSNHIAHAKVWKDRAGNHPNHFQPIRYADILNGDWCPVDEMLLDYCMSYTKALEEKNNFVLTIWPEHCIEGTHGQDVVPQLQSVIESWSVRRGVDAKYIKKGMNELTEMYSALQAEVPLPEDPSTELNRDLLNELKSAHKLVICGQALSHCVNWTTRHIVENWNPRSPSDIIILTDAASNVPGCESLGDAFLNTMRAAGVRLMTSTQLISSLKNHCKN